MGALFKCRTRNSSSRACNIPRLSNCILSTAAMFAKVPCDVIAGGQPGVGLGGQPAERLIEVFVPERLTDPETWPPPAEDTRPPFT